MKKLIYCALALAAGLFASSCQQENLEPVAQGNTVTYTVEIPDVTTKAIGDGSQVNQLVYAVYRIKDIQTDEQEAKEAIEDPNVCQFVYQKTQNVAGKTSTIVPLELINNQRYIVLFWAQNTNAWFNVEDHNLGSSNIAYPSDYQPNNDKYDAFTNVDYIELNSAPSKNITLTRPFGQLNIATNRPSTFNAEVNKTKVSVMGLAHSYNVATKKGSVTVDTPVAFAEAAPLKDAQGDYLPFGNYSRYISMNYVFVEDGPANVAVTYDIETTHGKVSNTINSVPVKKNYKTNIVGSLLTSNVDYNVTLEKEWGTPNEEIVLVNTASGLQEAVNNAETGVETEIKLDGDIDLNDLSALIGTLSTKAASAPSSLTIPSEKKVILNLNGYTLTQTVDYAGHSMIVNNGNLTLKGEGTIRYTYNGTPDTSNSKGNQTISNFGTLVLDGPTVENATAQMSHARFAIDTREGAICNIISGEVRCPNSMAIRMGQFGPDANVLNITGGHIYGARAVQVHLPSSSATVNPVMTLNVQGGLLESNDEEYNIGIYVISNGQSAENVAVTVGGEAQIKGSVLVNAVATDTMNDAAIQIIGGTIDGIYGVYSYSTDAAKADAVISVTGGAFAVEPNYVDPAYEAKEQDGKYVVVAKPTVAKIGETGYWCLNAAVADVEDGGVITLVADEVFTENNRYNNGGWWDGLGYSGDKSFTIDLGGHTISQNGALNDYLVWLKNDGTKVNTITFKNGTMDAGTTAYCALCTASSHVNKLTVNLENITLINNKSDGSTVKIRSGSELNVKAGTKITGKNSSLGVENWNAVVNIYDGAEIYMNGTGSYNGCLVGVGGNGTINVYGGYGKGVKGGFIAMTSGGTINVAGGEWIANTDGTVGNNSNLYVLTAQSNKYESGFAGPSIINVTGGTLRGGMDAWVLNNIEGEKAELNISGGNFNVNPTRFLATDYKAVEADGIWTVVVDPVAKVGDAEFASLEEAAAAAKSGDTITVLRDATLSAELTLPANVTLNGNGKQINGTIYAGGNLTFAGHTKVTAFSASYYDRVITIGEDACLEVTGGGRVSLAYGNTFNITGSIENAKTADKANIQPSLIIPAGISITGGSGATMNVTNAYVKIGDTSSKNSVANGTFTLNFNNSIAEFSKQLTFAEPTSGKTPTFNMNVKNSVLTTGTKLIAAAPNSNVKLDNSIVTLATYFRNSGKFEVVNGSVLTGSTIQFGENGGNDGELIVDASKVTINASSTGHALDGKGTGSITLTNGAEAMVTYYKGITVSADASSTFTGIEVQ